MPKIGERQRRVIFDEQHSLALGAPNVGFVRRAGRLALTSRRCRQVDGECRSDTFPAPNANVAAVARNDVTQSS